MANLAVKALELAPLDCLLLDANLRIVKANRCAHESLGGEMLIDRPLADLRPDLLNHPVLVALQKKTAEPLPTCSPSCSSFCLGNESFQPLHGEDGASYAIWFRKPVACSVHQKHLAQQVEQESGWTVKAAESTSRMQSEFIANINHEVRTPMNAIIGYTEMLANAPALGEREKRFVNIIHRSSLALVAIFNDIMELSKIDSGRIQIMTSSTRLQAMIDDIQELFGEAAKEKDLRFNCRVAPHLPRMFLLDGLRLKQVLQNLVSNALKFTNAGHVDLIVDGHPSPEAVGLYDLRLTVVDTGIGIPETDQQRIFELFERHESTHSSKYGGIGLGLTLCSRLVVMMGGSIELSSRVGEGSQFTVRLKGVKVADHTLEQLPAPQPTMVVGGDAAILVVDDVDMIKDVFVDFLRDAPVRVLTADNGEEAVRVAVAERPRLIFMDLNLEGSMDGRAVAERLRRQPETAAIPILVMTGEALEERDYLPLFDGALLKPFRLGELKQTIERYLRLEPELADTSPPPAAIPAAEDALLGCWTEELETLRKLAQRSGSLSASADLAKAMRRVGQATNQPILLEWGEELHRHVNEPDILGVDRCLAKLAQNPFAATTP